MNKNRAALESEHFLYEGVVKWGGPKQPFEMPG